MTIANAKTWIDVTDEVRITQAKLETNFSIYIFAASHRKRIVH